MAFAPSVRDQIVTNGTTADTTPTLNLPATVVAGDTLLVVYRCAVAGAVGWPDANWHELFDASDDAADDQFAAAWKLADGTEGGTTITLTAGNGKFAACAWSIRDADDPTLRAPELSTVATGTSAAQPNATTVTPTGGSKAYLFLTFIGMEGEETGITTYPTGYTAGQIFASSGAAAAVTTNCIVSGAAKRLATPAASDDAGAWTVAGTLDDWSAYTIAFHPKVLVEAVHITDTPQAGLTPLLAPVADQLVKVAETATVSLPPPPLTRDLGDAEAVKNDDIGQGATQLVGVLHITDTDITASLGAPGAGDLSTPTLVDDLKVADQLSASLSLLLPALLTESVKGADTPLAGLTPLLAIAADEPLTIGDASTAGLTPLLASVADAIRITDTLTDARLDPLLLTAPVIETLTVADGPALTISDLTALLADDVVHISDSVQTSPLGDLAPPVLTESLRVSDTSGGYLDPLQVSITTDVVHVVDGPATANSGMAVVLTETVLLTDAAQSFVELILDQNESVGVADQAPQLGWTPLLASVSEAIRIQDTASGSFDLERLVTETLKVQDTPSAALDHLVTTSQEALHVTDSAQASLIQFGTLVATLQDGLTVSESVQAALSSLDTSAQEHLQIQDQATAIVGAGTYQEEHLRVTDTVTAALEGARSVFVIHIMPRVTTIVVQRVEAITVNVRVTTLLQV